ncbi:MAG: phosphocholine cytidylyltransferase family protein [candidate division KSB1 bacterium]|nr:phosphocholine cytidylyltransferase family protein [candidate division KSB1 bacterium]
MQVVLLAAGEARRLRPLTEQTPKCLLEVTEGMSILDVTLENLRWAGLDEVVVVTGFYADKVRSHVARRYPSMRVHWVHNSDFAVTNNAYSLWLARDAVRGPFLLLDADILFDRRILAMLMGVAHRDALAVRTAGHWTEEDMKVMVDGDGWVRSISKAIPVQQATGESIGIEKFSVEFASALFAELSRRMSSGTGLGEFYEAAFQAVIDQGLRLYGLDISPLACVEVDTLDDYRHAQEVTSRVFGVR